jgi:alanyl-tRNA synthetase
VRDVRRPVPGLIVHVGEVAGGEFKVGQVVHLEVDRERRADIRRNHTATTSAAPRVARPSGQPRGAGRVAGRPRPAALRLHPRQRHRPRDARPDRARRQRGVLANQPVNVAYMGQKEAIAAGAMALFGEKYGDIVRTITVGGNGDGDASSPYSFELCGGLHVSETGEIGLFRFVSESAVGANTRRVEAVTGRGAYDFVSRRLACSTSWPGGSTRR